MDSLRSLALDIRASERTLRRAASEGLVRGERVSAHKFRTTQVEQEYLRRQWPLLAQLRALLRTEPNVALAVLFGSQADGTAAPGSDVDVLVELRRDGTMEAAGLSGRLSDALDRDVRAIRLTVVGTKPSLLLDVLAQGRVLVDRDGTWNRLKQDRRQLRLAADREPSLEQAVVDLELALDPGGRAA